MPIIHITIDDSTEALSIVSAALNGGYEVRIDLDEIDHTGIDALAQQAADNAEALLDQTINDHATKRNDDKLRGYAYALDSGDQIADRVIASVHYSGGIDGSGTYTILFTNGDEWQGKGMQVVAPFGIDQHMKAKRAAEQGREIAKRVHPVVDEVDQALRQQAYDARWLEAEASLIVRCPSCGARKNDNCVTPAGKPYRSFAHIDRIAAANKARAK